MVQLGLCAFRHGMIKDAHNSLHDVQSSGRAKELLAQVCSATPILTRVPEYSLDNIKKCPLGERVEK